MRNLKFGQEILGCQRSRRSDSTWREGFEGGTLFILRSTFGNLNSSFLDIEAFQVEGWVRNPVYLKELSDITAHREDNFHGGDIFLSANNFIHLTPVAHGVDGDIKGYCAEFGGGSFD